MTESGESIGTKNSNYEKVFFFDCIVFLRRRFICRIHRFFLITLEQKNYLYKPINIDRIDNL